VEEGMNPAHDTSEAMHGVRGVDAKPRNPVPLKWSAAFPMVEEEGRLVAEVGKDPLGVFDVVAVWIGE
jgi:hypothetical protein